MGYRGKKEKKKREKGKGILRGGSTHRTEGGRIKINPFLGTPGKKHRWGKLYIIQGRPSFRPGGGGKKKRIALEKKTISKDGRTRVGMGGMQPAGNNGYSGGRGEGRGQRP